MTAVMVTGPTILAVTLAQARANLRVDGTDMDDLITTWVKGVIANAEHEIGQCLMEQTWEVRLDAFPSIPLQEIGKKCPGAISDQIALPHPVMSITSVKYLDEAGVEQTMAPSAYRIKRDAYRTTMAPVTGTSWPATLDDTNVVTIVLQCGYGSTPDKTPDNVQLYILAKLVEQFDPHTRTERDTVQSVFVDRLLDACRSYA